MVALLEFGLELENVWSQHQVSAEEDDHAEDLAGLVGVAEEEDCVVGLENVFVEEGLERGEDGVHLFFFFGGGGLVGWWFGGGLAGKGFRDVMWFLLAREGNPWEVPILPSDRSQGLEIRTT